MISRGRSCALWGMLLLYVVARICQLYADQLPTLLIVILHVIPPAAFAIVHGSALYGSRGMSMFAVFCLGFGTLAESLSLRIGFPFGRYHFTDVMGPKLFQLPVLLALAYLGIGYVAWALALLILGYDRKPIRGMRAFALPILAALVMTSWDLSMDPVWAALDHAWVWEEGGAFFGVPITNFFGWFVTAYLYYQAFALYCRRRPVRIPTARQNFWLTAILVYAVCALGNLLILKQPMAPSVVTDAAGRHWATADILRSCVLVSLLVMVPFPLVAWFRVRKRSGGASDPTSARSPDSEVTVLIR
ncbi:MAG TPA: carotenoid biosynthesis protein [Bryobacteraceae bacterium]|nr:carotenoid biosynthesis protein [Bryobacteraceae bacterium]